MTRKAHANGKREFANPHKHYAARDEGKGPYLHPRTCFPNNITLESSTKPNAKPTQKLTEKAIQQQIFDALRSVGIWCFLTHKVGAFRHRPVHKGISDILGIWPRGSGRLLAIEVKRDGGRLTLDQVDFLRHVNEQGGTGFSCRSLEEVVEVLGLPIRL